MTTWQIEPLGTWTRSVTDPRANAARFKASWSDTFELLISEIEKLDPTDVIVVRLDVQRGDLRLDGSPLQSWQANLRAIALSLQALRAVDRYGVTRSGEQYVGWRAIEAAPARTFATADEALRWMRGKVAVSPDGLTPRQLYLAAAKQFHPDAGGDPAVWAQLDEARRLLELGGLW